jgi:hypothetical protein
MRRRFGRGRKPTGGAGERKAAGIDAARWLERLTAEGHVPVATLEAVEVDGVPDHFAVVGRGETETGTTVLVGFSPRHGGDAALAVLAEAQRLAASEEGFSGEAIAVAPEWSIAARRRLALVGTLPYRFRAVGISALGDDGGAVEGESGEAPLPLPAARIADGLARPEDRDLFQRALSAFEGLAAKHGGAVRGVDGSAELVLLAQRSAVLRVGDGAVVLETLQPERSTAMLEREGLAGAMDRLEGQLRKRLNDRKVRGGEEGTRAMALPALAVAAGLRDAMPWPLGGSDREVVDLAGLDPEGRPLVAAVRQRFGLTDLSALLDASFAMRAALPLLFAGSAPPVRALEPRLALVGAEIDEAVRWVLPALVFDHAFFTVRPQRSGAPEVLAGDVGTGAAARGQRRDEPRGERGDRGERGERGDRGERGERGGGRGRGRRRRGGRSRGSASGDGYGSADEASSVDERSDEESRNEPAQAAEDAAPAPMEELSLFDLDDEGRSDAAEGGSEDGGRGPRRRRGRRRGRRGPGAERSEEGTGDLEAPERKPGRARAEDDEVEEPDLLDADAELDPGETLAPLADVPDEADALPAYDDEEEIEEAGEEDWRDERELRRRARIAKASPEPEPAQPQRQPRRRCAIVAHADRDSILAAVLLARDLRLIEGIWIYPQEDLMTVFRGVATDLRGETPLHVIGFTPRPSHDAIQAASLYAGRLSWYDHHEWPPEDLHEMRSILGEENVVVEPGAGSSLPAVLADRNRRSRFSDKLVELGTGRFTQHDYERWGRLWWHRLGEIAGECGEKRSALDLLLAGRPSDLAKEAATVPAPPEPPEVAYVSQRDFRMVHFGGHRLVIVPVPDELDLHLTARVARERFAAEISLAHGETGELVVLSADDTRGRQGMDLGAMVSHLASKQEWISALRDEDHVARLLVQDLPTRPERLDALVAEVAMGRSILEG